MDPTRFDEWTKAIGATGSRRSALRLLAGGAAALLGRAGLEAAAACIGTGEPCAESPHCCSGACSAERRGEPPLRRCCLAKGRRCKKGAQCCSGACNRKTRRCACLADGKACTAAAAHKC